MVTKSTVSINFKTNFLHTPLAFVLLNIPFMAIVTTDGAFEMKEPIDSSPAIKTRLHNSHRLFQTIFSYL